jgi:hypothetical protein
LLNLISDAPLVLEEIKRILSVAPKARYFFIFPLKPRDRLKSKAEAWKSMMTQAGLETPRLLCLSGKNYKGKSLRLMVLTNIEPVG